MEMPAQPAPPQPQTQTQPQYAPPPPQPKSRRGCVTCLIVTLVILLLLTCCCSCSGFGLLSLAGAKGQPGTIIEPSSGESGKPSGDAIAIPKGLTAAAAASAIDLKWDSISEAKNIRIYRSEKPGKDFSKLSEVTSGISSFSDDTAKKGTTYYYVITALASSGAESGNSAQVAAVIDVPPLVPKGIYSWADVKTKAGADEEYLRILTKVTGLTMTDVDRLVSKEKSGTTLKTTMLKGTIITNTMEDYRIVPNFVLPNDREALTDENGVPQVMVKCGNPIKRQMPVTTPMVFIQDMQVFVTTIINVMPVNITNIFINAGQTANSITVSVLPQSVLVSIGPALAPPPPTIFVDPADFGDDLYDPETDIELEEGQKWIDEGKLLITATPADPAPKENVVMTVKIIPANSGVEVTFNVTGSDGYNNSGTQTTDDNGEITFTIPGGATEVHDVVTINVPSKNTGGSVEYTF